MSRHGLLLFYVAIALTGLAGCVALAYSVNLDRLPWAVLALIMLTVEGFLMGYTINKIVSAHPPTTEKSEGGDGRDSRTV